MRLTRRPLQDHTLLPFTLGRPSTKAQAQREVLGKPEACPELVEGREGRGGGARKPSAASPDEGRVRAMIRLLAPRASPLG